jgi:hypothetical protein
MAFESRHLRINPQYRACILGRYHNGNRLMHLNRLEFRKTDSVLRAPADLVGESRH